MRRFGCSGFSSPQACGGQTLPPWGAGSAATAAQTLKVVVVRVLRLARQVRRHLLGALVEQLEELIELVEELSARTVPELKELCRAAGLLVGGNKADLVERLVAGAADESVSAEEWLEE